MPDTAIAHELGGGWEGSEEWFTDDERAAAMDLPPSLSNELDRLHFREFLAGGGYFGRPRRRGLRPPPPFEVWLRL